MILYGLNYLAYPDIFFSCGKIMPLRRQGIGYPDLPVLYFGDISKTLRRRHAE